MDAVLVISHTCGTHPTLSLCNACQDDVCTFGEYDTLDRPGGVGNRALELVLGDDLGFGADVAAGRELVDPFLAVAGRV